MKLIIESQPNYLLVRFAAPTHLNTTETREFLFQIFNALKKPVDVILDCTHLDYLDSAGIGALIHLRKKLQQQGVSLKLAHINSSVRELLSISKLHRVFDLYDTIDAAIQSLAGQNQIKLKAESFNLIFETEIKDGKCILRLVHPDAILEVNHHQLLELARPLINQFRFLILELSRVKNMDSFGVTALIQLQSQARKVGGALLLVSRHRVLARLLKLYRVENLFELYPDMDGALKALATTGDRETRASGAEKMDSYVDLHYLRWE